MTKIRLETEDGRLVAEATRPPFGKPPEVVIWGQRVFKLHEDKNSESHGSVYREVFAWVVT